MPNIWAHIQFGREILYAAGMAAFLERTGWKNAFQLGCQGPDFLFYHRFLPWQGGSALNRLGSQMHGIRCGPFLLSLLGKVRERPPEHPAFAFGCGFLLHHVLDRNLHPFVFSRSGFRKWDHQRFETAMDAVILHRRAGISTGTVPVAPEVDTGGRLPGGLAPDFLALVRQHYPVWGGQITAGQLDEAVAHTLSAQRLFFDPSGWKGRLLFGQIDPFSPPRRLPGWDVLNDARRPWMDPTDRTVLHVESAEDLWDAALTDGQATSAAALAWLQAGDAPEAAELRARFAALLGDVSYETGRPCGTASITFAESIVPE